MMPLQDTKAEMAEHASDLEKLQTLSKELSEISPDGNKAQIQNKMDNLSNIFSTFKDTVKEKCVWTVRGSLYFHLLVFWGTFFNFIMCFQD